MAGDHHLAAAIVVGRLHHFGLTGFRHRGGFGADLARLVHVGAEQRGHGAETGRDGLLHRLAAQLQQAGSVGDAEGSRGGKGGVFAERVAGDDQRLLGQGEAAFFFQHTQNGERMGHERGLGVLGQGEFLARPLEHQFRELLAEGVIDFLEHLARGGEGGGEIAAHADGLAALAREDERKNRHA